MTLDELNAATQKAKLAQYNLQKIMMTPGFVPSDAGYKSVADALETSMRSTMKKIEAMVVAWEKEHPDD